MMGETKEFHTENQAPDVFLLRLERSIYFPGDTVQGSLEIQSRSEVKCSALCIKLDGRGQSSFSTQTRDVRHRHAYALEQQVLWGPIHKTPVKDGAGTNVVFCPPWSPEDGILRLVLKKTVQEVIVRVMHYEWGKPDVVIGEALLDVKSYVGRGFLEIPLTNGKRLDGCGFASMALSWESDPRKLEYIQMTGNQSCLKVHVLKTTGLRKVSWTGTNNVFVQTYALPEGSEVVKGQNLPVCEGLLFPASTLLIRFKFELPSDLPSSCIVDSGNYVNYSIYAFFDVGLKSNYSTRAFFTVIQPAASATMLRPVNITPSTYPITGQFCCCSVPLCCRYGNINVSGSLERGGYAPGEIIRINLQLQDYRWENVGEYVKPLNVFLTRVVDAWAEGKRTVFSRAVAYKLDIVYSRSSTINIQVPSIPPSYSGGVGYDAAWSNYVAKHVEPSMAASKPEPLTWRYELEVIVSVAYPGASCRCDDKEIVLTFPVAICSLGLDLLSELGDSDYWGNQEDMHVPVSTGDDVPSPTKIKSPLKPIPVKSQVMNRSVRAISHRAWSKITPYVSYDNESNKSSQSNRTDIHSGPESLCCNPLSLCSKRLVHDGEPKKADTAGANVSGLTDNNLRPKDWRTFQDIRHALPTLRGHPTRLGEGPCYCTRDIQEDYSVHDDKALTHQPYYIVVKQG